MNIDESYYFSDKFVMYFHYYFDLLLVIFLASLFA